MAKETIDAIAHVNHGRWVADCPTPYCGVAHLVEPGDRFMCEECGVDHGVVVFPDDAGVIDAVLSRRLVPTTRNWLPGETVADLEAENDAHMGEGVVT